jgi:hypothetical protein
VDEQNPDRLKHCGGSRSRPGRLALAFQGLHESRTGIAPPFRREGSGQQVDSEFHICLTCGQIAQEALIYRVFERCATEKCSASVSVQSESWIARLFDHDHSVTRQ